MTSSPHIGGALVSNVTLHIYSKQWVIVCEGGNAAFVDEAQGWHW